MTTLMALLIQYKLFIVFPAAFVIGPSASLASGFLLRLGYFDFLPLYFTLMAGELTGDIIWYWFGRHYGRSFIDRYGKYAQITDERVAATERLFAKYHGIILFVSKVTTGFGFSFVTLFTAGLTRVPFYRYVLINAFGQIFWTGGLIAAGYFTTHFYLTLQGLIAHTSIIAACVIVLVGFIAFGRYTFDRLSQNV